MLALLFAQLLSNQAGRSTPVAVYIPLVLLFVAAVYFFSRRGRTTGRMRDGEGISVDRD